MLLPRIITAIIGIPLVLGAVYWGGIPFSVLIGGVIVLALKEYFDLVRFKYECQPIVGIVVGVSLYAILFLNGTSFFPKLHSAGTAALISLMFVPIFLVEMFRRNAQRSIERMAVTFFGAFFIAWTLGHLVLLREMRPYGMLFIYMLFISVWILDTGAYAVGVTLGRNKLAPSVSPKKTIEGFLGGVFTGVAVVVAFRYFFLSDIFSVSEAAFVGLGISIVAQFSDLAESLLKRDIGAKDSADILPGHGGILDRFDSYLFAAPLLYYYLVIFK